MEDPMIIHISYFCYTADKLESGKHLKVRENQNLQIWATLLDKTEHKFPHTYPQIIPFYALVSEAVQGLAMAAPSALASLQSQQQQIQAAIAPSALQQPVPGAVTPAALAAAHTTVAAGLPGTIQATPVSPLSFY